MTDLNHFAVAGTATQPQRLVVTDCVTVDEAQASGAWIAAAPGAVAEREP